jgi:large subunit ribosomal protein L28
VAALARIAWPLTPLTQDVRALIFWILSKGKTMTGRCDICGKTVAFGHNVSHSNRKTNRMFRPNVQKAVLLLKGQPTRVKACTRCIRTNRKHAAAV